MPARRRIAVLGSTGSIGTSTLDVIAHCSDRLELVGLSAHSNLNLLAEQVARYRPRLVVLTDPEAQGLASSLPPGPCKVLLGDEGVREMVSDPEVDTVVVAIVGAAGLLGTLAAVEAGKTVAVANKETLVMAGPLVMRRASECGATIVPIDSEHSAIFQLLQCGRRQDVERLVLTGSGGPFRGKKAGDLQNVTVEEALRHPTWRMGRKITIDSATLMNKALEIIEARWLFGMSAEQIGVVIHPESIVHSFVEFQDGSVLAQLSPPDMRLPIQYALLHPERVPGPSRRLDWAALRALHFEPPDPDTFPAIQLGYETARRGGTCGAVLNAANEAAVQRFLAGTLRFLDITRVCRAVLESHAFSAQPSLEELLALDRWARQEVENWPPG
jgi:1-deoxy-D-xylulose-5-phosphate reductoisomerase